MRDASADWAAGPASGAVANAAAAAARDAAKRPSQQAGNCDGGKPRPLPRDVSRPAADQLPSLTSLAPSAPAPRFGAAAARASQRLPQERPFRRPSDARRSDSSELVAQRAEELAFRRPPDARRSDSSELIAQRAQERPFRRPPDARRSDSEPLPFIGNEASGGFRKPPWERGLPGERRGRIPEASGGTPPSRGGPAGAFPPAGAAQLAPCPPERPSRRSLPSIAAASALARRGGAASAAAVGPAAPPLGEPSAAAASAGGPGGGLCGRGRPCRSSCPDLLRERPGRWAAVDASAEPQRRTAADFLPPGLELLRGETAGDGLGAGGGARQPLRRRTVQERPAAAAEAQRQTADDALPSERRTAADSPLQSRAPRPTQERRSLPSIAARPPPPHERPGRRSLPARLASPAALGAGIVAATADPEAAPRWRGERPEERLHEVAESIGMPLEGSPGPSARDVYTPAVRRRSSVQAAQILRAFEGSPRPSPRDEGGRLVRRRSSVQAQILRSLGDEFRQSLKELWRESAEPGGLRRPTSAEEAPPAAEAGRACREERFHEAAESLGVPLSTVRAARALFQEYAADAAAAVACDLKALCGGGLGQAQFELLVEVLSDMQPDCQRSAELRGAFMEADKAGTGSITFDQFATLLCKHSYSESMIVDRLSERGQNRALAKELDMTLHEVENLRLDYKKYDVNGDGEIDKEEFKLLLEDSLKVKMKDWCSSGGGAARVQHWWKFADEDKGGTVSFEEFIRFHKKFFGTAKNQKFPLEDFYRCGGMTCIRRM